MSGEIDVNALKRGRTVEEFFLDAMVYRYLLIRNANKILLGRDSVYEYERAVGDGDYIIVYYKKRGYRG